MLRERALVLEITKKYATVMLPGGTFRLVRRRGRHLVVGQEIWFARVKFGTWGAASLALAVSFAMAILLALQGIAPASAQAVGVVSVDINPSINLLVTSRRTVAKAIGLDAAGRRILSQYQPVGTSVTNAVVTITGIAVSDGYSGPRTPIVLIGGVFTHGVPPWFASIVSQEQRAVTLHHWQLSVTDMAVDNGQWMQTIQKRSMSVGRYLLWRYKHKGHGNVSSKMLGSVPLGRLLSKNVASRPIRPTVAKPLSKHHHGSSRKTAKFGGGHKQSHPQLIKPVSHSPKSR